MKGLLRYFGLGLVLAFSLGLAVLGTVITYLLSTLPTGVLWINLLAAMVAFWIIAYPLFAFVLSKWSGVAAPRRWAALAVGAATVVLSAAAVYPTLSVALTPAPPAGEPVLTALRDSTFPLTTVEAGRNFADLAPLMPILDGKRVVALGEATHGTHEFFAMKHRLLAFLVQEMGFEHFAMELSPGDGEQLNRYVMGEDVDLTKVLYWPWATSEVLEMLDWMRAYNADSQSPHKVMFHGMDPRGGVRDPVMAANVAALLSQYGPESKVVLWAHNCHISAEEGWMGHDLKKIFGDEVYLLGFEFDHGAFTSRTAVIHTFSTGSASSDYYAHALTRLDEPLLFLDFDTLVQDSALAVWLTEPQRSHSFDELHVVDRLCPAWHTKTIPWPDLYDGVIFVEESTPAREMPAR